MKSRIMNFFTKVRASYWYIPLLMSILAILLSVLTLEIDQRFALELLFKFDWFHSHNPEGARAVLSTIATSMITVACVTFSMTIVAVSFAASQIGPRLTSNFMRDRPNQITLGTFIATYLYCLLVLRNVVNIDGTPFVPQLSMLIAVILSICSILVLIYFIHHIPESINMSNVIANLGEDLNCQAENLFPTHIGQQLEDNSVSIPKYKKKYKETIISEQYGYIRILDGSMLINMAEKNNFIIELKARPGAYIAEGSTLLEIYSEKKIDSALCNHAKEAFVLGHTRNQEQDILFLIDEMIEIIARALSPGVNDPFTAMTCINWLQIMLQKLSNSPTPSAYRRDSHKNVRLIAHPLTFIEFCDLIFSQIQTYVSRDRNVALHLMKMIHHLYGNSNNDAHRKTLASHAYSLKESAVASLPLKIDRNKIQKLYTQCFD